jgi:aminoglycoside phosphotransferase (APT) family kinase protein
VGATRIGVDYGLSGRAFRVVADTERGPPFSFVVKKETADAVERALIFHRKNGTFLRSSIPECFAGGSDPETGRGFLILEDVTPAEQGDVLRGCTDAKAIAVVQVLARVHGTSWTSSNDAFPGTLPRWAARPFDPHRWTDRLTRAGKRFPLILTADLSARLHGLPEKVARAIEHLRSGPASWIHVDAHLDNVLWRPDGRAVLLDWCGAAIGPPSVDVARCLTEGLDAGSRPQRAAALMSAYAQGLQSSGVSEIDVAGLWTALRHALLPLLQSAVGWAARPEDRAPSGRMAALRENLLRSACAWVASTDDLA